MWGGRFSSRPAEIMQAINVSIGVDQRLWRQDLAGSRAHCRMLAAQGIVGAADAEVVFPVGKNIHSALRVGQLLRQPLEMSRQFNSTAV